MKIPRAAHRPPRWSWSAQRGCGGKLLQHVNSHMVRRGSYQGCKIYLKLFLGRPLENAKPLKFLWKAFPELSDASGRQPRGTKERPGTPPVCFEGPTDSPREPKDAPRPSKLQPRCLKKATKMQFAMHFLNVVRQNVVSNGFPKNLLRFLAVLTLTIVWQGRHIQHFCDFRFLQQLCPQIYQILSGVWSKIDRK